GANAERVGQSKVTVSDLRQSRRVAIMNGSKPYSPSSHQRPPTPRPEPRADRAYAASPSPQPSPSGRGRNVRRAAKDQSRLIVHHEFDGCSLSHRERVRVRGNYRNSDPAYRTSKGTVELRESSGRAGGIPGSS